MVGGAYLNNWNLFFLFFKICSASSSISAGGWWCFFLFLWLLSFVIDPCTFADLFGIA
jgi:hypothetical protein